MRILKRIRDGPGEGTMPIGDRRARFLSAARRELIYPLTDRFMYFLSEAGAALSAAVSYKIE